MFAYNNSIKEFRKKKGYTQKELAEKVGISRTALIRYENGATSPNIEVIEKIADVLDVPLDNFLPLKSANEELAKAIANDLSLKSFCDNFFYYLSYHNVDIDNCSNTKLMQLFASYLEER